jgi:hypothetical protein
MSIQKWGASAIFRHPMVIHKNYYLCGTLVLKAGRISKFDLIWLILTGITIRPNIFCIAPYKSNILRMRWTAICNLVTWMARSNWWNRPRFRSVLFFNKLETEDRIIKRRRKYTLEEAGVKKLRKLNLWSAQIAKEWKNVHGGLPDAWIHVSQQQSRGHAMVKHHAMKVKTLSASFILILHQSEKLHLTYRKPITINIWEGNDNESMSVSRDFYRPCVWQNRNK